MKRNYYNVNDKGTVLKQHNYLDCFWVSILEKSIPHLQLLPQLFLENRLL